MTITEKVKSDVAAAMKAGDKERLAALRMLLSSLQLAGKEAAGPFGEQEEIAVLMTEKKKRQQSAEAFRSGGRDDRAASEEAEAALINTYLPEAIGRDELEEIVNEAIAATGAQGPRDMGKVMAAVMPRVAGRADGREISEIVKGRLA